MTTVVDEDEPHGLELPDGVLPDGQVWHPRTIALWDALRRHPMLADELDLGWEFLIDTALMHHTMWSKGKWEYAAELRLRVAKFGATPEDRMRLKMKVEKPDADKAKGPATVTEVSDHRRNLRIAE